MNVYAADQRTQEKMLSWGRYLFWAEILCQRFNDFMDSPHDIENSVDSWTFFALMSQWYASVWVVVEGWQKLGFDDKAINDLIQQRSDFCDLLKRYRNGVFHYQPKMIEERFLAFLREGDEHAIWVNNLHNEFLRFFWKWVDNFPGTAKQKEEFRQIIISVIGWVPENIVPARIQELERMTADAENMIAHDKESKNPYTRSLRGAITNARNILRDIQKERDGSSKEDVCNDN